MVIHMSQIGSKRISKHFGTGIFAELNEKKEEMEKKGRKLYNLSLIHIFFVSPMALRIALPKL